MRKYFNKLCCVLEFILELLIGLGGMAQSAQTVGPCNTVQLNIDFGNATTTAPSLARHAQYRYQSGDCPNDGGYALLSATNGCFDNKWHSLPQDHTPGDVQGRMLLVNAALEPGPFFTWRATGLTPGTKMELGAWLVNICYTADGCTPTPPIVRLTLRSDDGRLVGLFETGAIAPTKFPKWQWYTGNFTVPAGVDALTLTMENLIKGGCGNDFAVDDITLATCTAPETPVVQATAPATPKPTATPRPTAPPTAPLPKPSQRPVTVTAPRAANAPAQQPVVQPRAVTVIPPPIANRENPVVKTIEVAAGEIIIDLYDNGDIDGDIISIYHNNRLVVSRATLSGNPLTVRLSIDANQPYHELVMVAENLGSIPPNTAVMIVTAQKKRHEVFISSSEQKNAKVLLVLEK